MFFDTCRRIIWGEKGEGLLFFLFALLKGLSLWLVLFWHFPDAPLSSQVMYRRNDIEYFQLFGAASRFQTGEFQILEEPAKNFSPFFLKAQPFGLAVSLFGIKGLLLVDVLGTALYYLLLAVFLYSILSSLFLSQVLSLSAITIEAVANRFFNQNLGFSFVSFWDLRIPNPFVGELLSICCLILEFNIFFGRNGSLLRKILGLCIPLVFLITSNFPYFVFHVLVLFALFCQKTVLNGLKKTAVDFLPGAVALGVALLLFASHFPPEIDIRNGIFPLNRWPLLFNEGFGFLVLFGIIGWAIARMMAPKTAEEQIPGLFEKLRFVTGVSIIAWLTTPLFQVVTGKAAQLHNFQYIFERVLGMFLLILLGLLLKKVFQLACPGPGFNSLKARLVFPASILIVSLATVFSLLLANYDLLRRNHRTGYYEPQIPSYRNDFMEMTSFVQKRLQPQHKVLGTFDLMVHSWWLLNFPRFVYHPDPCFSTVSDEVVTSRVLQLCKIIGMKEEAFEQLLHEFYFNLNWLYVLTYVANEKFSRVPITEYPPHVQNTIARTSPMGMGCFHAPIPPRVISSLKESFRSKIPDCDFPRLDIIILTKDSFFSALAPASDSFLLCFENSSFKVFEKRVPIK